jgi:hypothetical protein
LAGPVDIPSFHPRVRGQGSEFLNDRPHRYPGGVVGNSTVVEGGDAISVSGPGLLGLEMYSFHSWGKTPGIHKEKSFEADCDLQCQQQTRKCVHTGIPKSSNDEKRKSLSSTGNDKVNSFLIRRNFEGWRAIIMILEEPERAS